MAHHIIVFNAGSSSLKFKLFETTTGNATTSIKQVATGSCKEIGSDKSTWSLNDDTQQRSIASHEDALTLIIDELKANQLISANNNPKPSSSSSTTLRVGHRVVHGGDRRDPVKVTSETLEQLEELTKLAPLHNHRAVVVMRASLDRIEGADNYAYFDTMFHATLPEFIYTYPLPREKAFKCSIRKWGFHGLSHEFVANAAARHLQKPLKDLKLVTLHLGNGSSACAIKFGKSFDTSMGLTPVSGLPASTRSGDIDPSAVFHLVSDPSEPKDASGGAGVELSKAEHVLNKESGFKGLCGISHVGELVKQAQEKSSREAQLSLDILYNRIQNFVGAYFVALEGGVDAIVFTGGIGEASPQVRQGVTDKLQCLGCKIDKDKNNKTDASYSSSNGSNGVVDISEPNTAIKTLVIETNEELRIAEMMMEQEEEG
ncbi:Acetokinase family-domain-containing protein [Zychaea mexicana]|uniref:Acetokinase family-domain-containing protein n=1 Tax=Zychaea mexicana TaxID=64656 RepID=UPI0022FEA30D|nr:Acetokinase family-domain-containing protein [Zychaea mexicana]KAI9488554.1 Acetokinase family-domain-containing protein [Zychaea mexicana]